MYLLKRLQGETPIRGTRAGPQESQAGPSSPRGTTPARAGSTPSHDARTAGDRAAWGSSDRNDTPGGATHTSGGGSTTQNIINFHSFQYASTI